MRYEAILWDLDGTLLDTIGDLCTSVNAALAANGLPSRTKEEVLSFVGNGIHKLIERAVPETCDEQTLEATFSAFCAHYEAHCGDTTRPYDGILPLLQRLSSMGVRSAVVSNKATFAVEQLAAEHFPNLLAMALGATEHRRTKPAPDIVEEALSRLDVLPERVLYIGDSEVDVATAAAAGLDAVFVTWGFRTREQLIAAGATCLVNTVAELEKRLFEGERT